MRELFLFICGTLSIILLCFLGHNIMIQSVVVMCAAVHEPTNLISSGGPFLVLSGVGWYILFFCVKAFLSALSSK
jgi:hypothetical protein